MTTPEPYFDDGQVRLFLGDCLDVLAGLDDDSVDAVVTDPPYGLEFMGREWDTFKPAKAQIRTRADQRTNPGDGKSVVSVPESYTAGQPFQAWCLAWASECLRVLKPGGHLLAFGGTRTWHRLACAVEDAGFEIRDSVADLTGIDGPGLLWVYGQGFPKSLDVSKAIDKQGRGAMVRAKLLHFAAERGVDGRWLEARGVASASSFKDWTVGGHVPSDQNWQIVKGALEVTDAEEAAFDRLVVARAKGKGSRSSIGPVGIGEADYDVTTAATEDAARWEGWGTALKPAWEPVVVGRKPLAGTVAQNVVEHGPGALNIDGCRVDGGSRPARSNEVSTSGLTGSSDTYGSFAVRGSMAVGETSEGRWPPNVMLGDSAATELDRQCGTLTSGANPTRRNSDKFRDAYGEFAGQAECTPQRGAESGGASRFFPVFRYEAKAPVSERPRLPDGTAHPTVKPLDLMRWLVRLVTPPGGTVGDFFAGSGTTAEACIIEGFNCILAEKDPAHAELIKARLAKPIQPDLFGGAA